MALAFLCICWVVEFGFFKQPKFVVVGMRTVVAVGMGMPVFKLGFMEVSGWCIT